MVVGGQYIMRKKTNQVHKNHIGILRERTLDMGSSSYGSNRTLQVSGKEYVSYHKMRVVNIPWDDTLALRRGPSTSYRKIAEIPPDGTDLEVYKCRYGWCRIRYGRYIGWASEKYLMRYSGNDYRYKRRARVSGVPWNDTLAVRSGYSVRYSRVGDLPPDARGIEVRKCYRKWCYIRYGNLMGWSSGKYLRSY